MTRVHRIVYVIAAIGLLAISDEALFAETPWSLKANFTLVGVTLEVIGIALLALDLWLPQLRRSWEWLTRWGIRTRLREVYRDVIARLTGTRGSANVSVGLAGEVNVAGTLTLKVELGEIQSFDQVRERLQAITDRITAIEGANAEAHEELRTEVRERDRRTRQDVEEWIRQNSGRFLPWRILGFAIALIGSVVLAIANVMS